MKLGILEQNQVVDGRSIGEVLGETVQLATCADVLGYHRFWVTEHHSPRFGCGHPEPLVTALGAATKKIRVGTGGVMLRHRNPYHVAKCFQVLSGLFPGRLDLGFGSAPSAAGGTLRALADYRGRRSFERKARDLLAFVSGSIAKGDRYEGVPPLFCPGEEPELWWLCSGIQSAKFAAQYGFRLAYGRFIKPDNGFEVSHTYTRCFRPSKLVHKAHHLVCIGVICSEDNVGVARLVRYWGRHLLKTKKDADAFPPEWDSNWDEPFNPQDLREVTSHFSSGRYVIGTPETCINKLKLIQRKHGVEELMVCVMNPTFDAKIGTLEALKPLLNE